MKRSIVATTVERIAEERRGMHTNLVALIMFVMFIGGLMSMIPTKKKLPTSRTSVALVGHNNATELDDCQVVQTVDGDRFADFYASSFEKDRLNYARMEVEFWQINHINSPLIYPGRLYLMSRGMEVDEHKLSIRRASRG